VWIVLEHLDEVFASRDNMIALAIRETALTKICADFIPSQILFGSLCISHYIRASIVGIELQALLTSIHVYSNSPSKREYKEILKEQRIQRFTRC
jgi:hypothetical protein